MKITMKKKIHYNSRLAKILLFLGTCHTIMFFGFVLSKRKAVYISRETENHEFIHVVQYWVCFTIGAVAAIFLTHVSWWFLLLPPLLYYILYVLEAAVSFVHHFFSTRKKNAAAAADKAYYASAMEMEAYANEHNPEYLKDRVWYANFLYYHLAQFLFWGIYLLPYLQMSTPHPSHSPDLPFA